MASKSLIQVTKNYMGEGDEVLGKKLIQNFFAIRNNDGNLPKIMLFYNAGVKLLCEEGPVLDIFREIEAKGVKMIVCGTCLDHFGLADKLKAGMRGTMVDIINLQEEADKVLTI